MVTKPPATFSASELRSRAVLEQIEKERAATDAKTARLKALRLAKEAEDLANAAAAPAPSTDCAGAVAVKLRASTTRLPSATILAASSITTFGLSSAIRSKLRISNKS